MVIEIEGCIKRRSGGRGGSLFFSVARVFRLKFEAPAKHLFREKNVLCFLKGIAVQGRKYRVIWALCIKVYRVYMGWKAGFYIGQDRETQEILILCKISALSEPCGNKT